MSDDDCITTIRGLALDVVQKANSGHPGAPVGMAPVAHVLWESVLNFDPEWPARDRFVLSNGHACALLYILLNLYGVLPMDELKNFRQLGSKTPGHPERGLTPGVEVTTGPLGQGLANAVGMAIAQAHLNKRFPGLFDNHTYVFCGDGCLQEGITSEACSLAGHLGLNRLIAIYDNNHITIDGDTALSFTENVTQRFQSYGWNVIEVTEGDLTSNIPAIAGAISVARGESQRPTLIVLTTTIGYGTSKAGTAAVHGAPLGADAIADWKKMMKRHADSHFFVPEDVKARYGEAAARGKRLHAEWRKKAEAAAAEDKTGVLAGILRGDSLPGVEGGAEALVLPSFGADDKKATRQSSQDVVSALAAKIPTLIGGSADLTGSNLTLPKGVEFGDFQKDSQEGRYLRFGVREHAMTAIGNGIAAYGGMVPYVGTFLNFVQYALPSVRLAALSHLRLIFVATHDSIGLGEDGPTHQPVEVGAQLRATPNCLTIRPADGNEVAAAYRRALTFQGPTVICLSRQACPCVVSAEMANAGLPRGGYIVREAGGKPVTSDGAAAAGAPKPTVVMVSSGSEVNLAMQAAAEAEKTDGVRVRVVSVPIMETFLEQPDDYLRHVLPDGVPVIAVEAWVRFGWDRIAHYTMTVDSFGASAPFQKAYAHFGLSVDAMAPKIVKASQRHASEAAPPRFLRNPW
eukprot:TRINITY_DN23518_c0_g1_i1.p1 TRINITY_DN23518_c0_g1~~TRINITY_DN23518_c0_g1_i1.p1  ORF type:complete len:687 (+),score=201.63 TRINITY_DN23518_c0_g1_i1:67-2127(+)